MIVKRFNRSYLRLKSKSTQYLPTVGSAGRIHLFLLVSSYFSKCHHHRLGKIFTSLAKVHGFRLHMWHIFKLRWIFCLSRLVSDGLTACLYKNALYRVSHNLQVNFTIIFEHPVSPVIVFCLRNFVCLDSSDLVNCLIITKVPPPYLLKREPSFNLKSDRPLSITNEICMSSDKGAKVGCFN